MHELLRGRNAGLAHSERCRHLIDRALLVPRLLAICPKPSLRVEISQVQRCAWVKGAQGDLCAGIPQGRKHSVRAGGVKKRRDDQRVLVAARSHARNSRIEPSWEAPTAASAGA